MLKGIYSIKNRILFHLLTLANRYILMTLYTGKTEEEKLSFFFEYKMLTSSRSECSQHQNKPLWRRTTHNFNVMGKNRSVCQDHKFIIIIIMNMVNIVHMWTHTPRTIHSTLQCRQRKEEWTIHVWSMFYHLSQLVFFALFWRCCCCVLSVVFVSIVMSCQSIFAAVAKYVWSVPIISSFSLNFKWHINHWKCKQINNMGRMHRTQNSHAMMKCC